MNLLIIGMGGHGYVTYEIAKRMHLFNKIDFIDDHNDQALGTMKDLKQLQGNYDTIHVSIGNNTLREEIYKKAKGLGYTCANLIDPTSYVSESAQLAEGVLIEPHAIVNANTVIGDGTIISVGAIVDHNAVIENYCHINAGAICKAGSHVKAYAKVDAGEVVKGY